MYQFQSILSGQEKSLGPRPPAKESKMSSYVCLEGAKRALDRLVWRVGLAVFSISAIIGTSACRSTDSTSSTSNPSPTASQPAAPRGLPVPCDNPYYPAENGSIRNYRINGGGSSPSTLTYSEQKTNVTVGSFIDHREFSDGTRVDAWWYCTPEGLVASEYSIPAVVRLSSTYQIESARATGPALPPADKWATGYEWTTAYVVAGTQKSGGSQSPEKFSGTIEVKSQIVSAEKTTVPAGSYDC